MSTAPDGKPSIAAFAGFEFNLATGELRKYGVRIKLQGQPIDVLTQLIQHAGEVVTREELQNRLWPADTYVDFEHSLNAAIKRLRAALGDSAESPRFIETIPRRGYRFIAPLIRPVADQAIQSEPLPEVAAPMAPPSAVRKSPPRKAPIILAVAGIALAAGAAWWLQARDYFWQNPIAGARFQPVTDSEGVAQDAAISRDGHFIAFLSDRQGQMDVWVTQVGSGDFHNLTHGSAPELVNPSVRALGFSPDGSLVTYWVRKPNRADAGGIDIWAVPTLGGQPKPYLEGVAEFDWSKDGARLVYHTTEPGDPMFTSDGSPRVAAKPIYRSPAGLHNHFPAWSTGANFVYFVHGSIPDNLDIWRLGVSGGSPERITSHNARVSHPILLDRRTLLYLATDTDGSGPWLYDMDVEHRIPHRLTSGIDRYTSLAASSDGRRLVVTALNPKRTLWRVPVANEPMELTADARVPLTTSAGFAPRLGPNYLIYVSAAGSGDAIWKLVDGVGSELWSGQSARVVGGPAISADGRDIAFSVRQNDRTSLYTMRADGTNARVIADSFELRGAPAWTPDGRSITIAVNEHGQERLFTIPTDGRPPAMLVRENSFDPAWAPDGSFVIYSGPEIGPTFSVKAITPSGAAYALPQLTLTRGSRRLVFLRGKQLLVFLKGQIQHKNLWSLDLSSGHERQLTNVPADFEIHDFDISPDGKNLILEQWQERSDVLLVELAR
jgi:Tol biopolymer transport system component/DNA-binding winged helix-turn-helix (wHTH) protein